MGGTEPWPRVPMTNADHANAAVVIIGAGISGICTAIDLIKKNKCRDFVIIEKSLGVGGTWHDNKYPGSSCDVWSHLYSYSFATRPDWTRNYPGQEEILAYLTSVASSYNLYSHIRFGSTVDRATWDPSTNKWKVHVITAPGSKDAESMPQYEINCDFLVSGVGQLNQPNWPDFRGMKNFEGKVMHSARWDWGYDLVGKKVAVIGNGATAVQIIPEVAKCAEKVTVYQRTANWIVPRHDEPISPLARTLYKYIPPLRWRLRASRMVHQESLFPAVTSANTPLASAIRDSCISSIKAAFPSDPEMQDLLTPKYSPGCKRILVDDDYYRTLAQPHVSLETRPICCVDKSGIRVQGTDRELHEEFDVIVLATGFHTLDFTFPIDITGSCSRSLRTDIWEKKKGEAAAVARAYNGVAVEDLPNFGILYGPNTNLGHNSVIVMIEAQSRYINALVKPVLDARRKGKDLVLKIKKERVDEFNEGLKARLEKTSFADQGCTSWYKTAAGTITNNWAGTAIEYQKLLSRVDWDDYEIEGSARADVLAGGKSTYIGRVVEEAWLGDAALVAAAAVAGAALVGAGWLARNQKMSLSRS